MRLFFLNIKYVFQSLKKNIFLSLLTIFGLTIGITVFVLTTLFVINEQTVNSDLYLSYEGNRFRKVNGASVIEIIKMLNIDFVKLVLIVILTVSWRTFKVAQQNPIEALRYE